MAKDYTTAINRLDEYTRLISATLILVDTLRRKSTYGKFPEDLQVQHKRTWEMIINDIKSMDYEAKDLASMLADERDNEKNK